jgi:peptidyl-prolyl cis-trans isomerase A (cyclophilin A)
MRHAVTVALLLSTFSLCAWGQTKTTTKPAAPAAKPAATPATPAAAANPVAVFDTTAGKLRCTLFEQETPITVANFIGLATGTKDWTNPVSRARKHNTPLFDGTIFHRVIPEFMIQGGDPAGTGAGDPGYTFKDEFVPTLKFDRPGRLAMANSGPNTNGSQFFITEDSAHSFHLSGHHTIFGQCDAASVELVKRIARMPRDPNDKPLHAVRITHITIERGGAAATAPAKPAAKPAAKAPMKPAPKKSDKQ